MHIDTGPGKKWQTHKARLLDSLVRLDTYPDGLRRAALDGPFLPMHGGSLPSRSMEEDLRTLRQALPFRVDIEVPDGGAGTVGLFNNQ